MGKQALCIECGSVFEMGKNISLAKDSIKKYLQYFKIINGKPLNSKISKINIHVYKTVVRKKGNEKIVFSKKYKDFELLKDNEIFVSIDKKSYIAKNGDYIIFPRKNAKVENEIFILGKEQNKL